MAMNTSRSLNHDLTEGLTDGKYRKVVNNRGGNVDPTTQKGRADLYDRFYGIHEAQTKITPDGLALPTPQYVPTREPLLF